MRALRIAALSFAILSLVGGTSAVAIATTEATHAIGPVAGSVDVHWIPGGTFNEEDRVFQYRDYAMAGSAHRFSDPRMAGDLVSDWNWDVVSSGDQPIPAWGSITIEGADGSWHGDFTGFRPNDFQPVGVRALLFGDGAYEGLCATLDITVVGLGMDDTWFVDGVVHPVTMG